MSDTQNDGEIIAHLPGGIEIRTAHGADGKFTSGGGNLISPRSIKNAPKGHREYYTMLKSHKLIDSGHKPTSKATACIGGCGGSGELKKGHHTSECHHCKGTGIHLPST